MEQTSNKQFKDIESKPVYLLKGFMLSAMISGYIIGPLLVIGGGSWWMYKQEYISKIWVIGAVIVAFIISNALIILMSKRMIKTFNKKTGITDPSPEQVEEWKKNRPDSYKYKDDDEDEED